jgi:hypothetical protein
MRSFPERRGMSDKPNSRSTPCSRRGLLLGAMAAVGAATVTGGTAAADALKVSQSAVAYQDHPNGDKECGVCAQFLPPGSCQFVAGTVSPHGYCRVFSRRQSASAD